MSVIGNILWFVFAGFWQGVSWCLVGLLWCITIVGIPVGTQCFKMAGLAFFPFGKEVEYGGGAGSAVLNVLWFIFGGVFLALEALLNGVLLCITIIGIPFGLQCFKFASLAFFPFGKDVVYGGGSISFLANIIWLIFFGWEMALGYLALGAVWCITIVGIPVGMQCFKMAKLSLMPFGADVIS